MAPAIRQKSMKYPIVIRYEMPKDCSPIRMITQRMMMYPIDLPIPQPIRPIRGFAIAVVVLLGVGTLIDLFSLIVAFNRASLISALIDSPESVDMDAVNTNDNLSILLGWAQTFMYVLTGIAFVIWLYRARSNAESLTLIPHRRNAAWAVFGWVVPIVSLWFPKQIVDDIWATSKPSGPDISEFRRLSLNSAPRSGLVMAWWASWLISTWVSNFFYRVSARSDDLDSYLMAANIEIYFALPTLTCAVLAAMVVLKITGFQDRRPATFAPAV